MTATQVGVEPLRVARGSLRTRRGGGVILVVAVVAFSWWTAGSSLTPAAGLDNSWAVGLSLAIARGLAFGKQLMFTYGPLGLAVEPRAVTAGTLVLGVVGAAAIWLALVAVVLRALRRLFAWPIAALIAILGLGIVGTEPWLPFDEIAFGLVAIALTQPPARARQAALALALAGGVLAGLALLVKLNEGIGAAAIIAAGLLGSVDRRQYMVIGGLMFVLTTLLAWLALGQPLAALPDYVRTGRSLVQGYVDAMGEDTVGAGGQWEVLVVLLSAAVLTAAAWSSLAEAPLRRRVALAGCVLFVHYFVARGMFVRWAPGHASEIALLVAVALMIPWKRSQLAIGSAVTVALAVAALAGLGSSGVGLGSALDPFGRASALVSNIKTMIWPGATIARGRRHTNRELAVPPEIVAAFYHHCVNVEPIEAAAIFAFPSWRWCPIGVMQSYAAYTTELDNLDAAGYANARSGPDRVLRQAVAIDGRNPTWESPAAMLSLLCHFKEIGRGGRWQALARIPDRCGKPRLLGSFHSGGPKGLPIPAAPRGSVLVAQVHGLQIYRAERLETLFVRPAERALIVNGVSYRVVPDTLTDGLILDVPSYADYVAPFNLNLGVHLLEAKISAAPVAFSVTFLVVPINGA